MKVTVCFTLLLLFPREKELKIRSCIGYRTHLDVE
jgi:hypothetical protein